MGVFWLLRQSGCWALVASRSRFVVSLSIDSRPSSGCSSQTPTATTSRTSRPPPKHPSLRSNMADKLRAQQQLEALQARYIGIGSADTTKHEWTSNMARDSLSSYVGHPPLLQYMSIGLGQSREKTRVQLLERMIRPVGPPPEVSE